MIAQLERFVDQPFTYNFDNGPAQVTDETVALEEGLNCVSLAHLAIDGLFNCRLPGTLHCYEMYRDQEYLEDVSSVKDMQVGDMVFFGRREAIVPPEEFVPQYDETGYLLNWRESPVTHVALYTGVDVDGVPLMLHATHFEGKTTLWPLTKFFRYSMYGELRRIARVRQDSILDNA